MLQRNTRTGTSSTLTSISTDHLLAREHCARAATRVALRLLFAIARGRCFDRLTAGKNDFWLGDSERAIHGLTFHDSFSVLDIQFP